MTYPVTKIRYNVHLSLGAGGARVGQFKTLAEAREFSKGKNYHIFKTWYTKYKEGGRYHQVAYQEL